jgi:hypothetical protein
LLKSGSQSGWIAKIRIAKIGIAKIRIRSHHHLRWVRARRAKPFGTSPLWSVGNASCKPLDHFSWLPPLQSNTFSPAAHHVITTAQHCHFGHLYILRTSWSLKCHPCVRLYSLTIVKFSPLSSPSQKVVTIAKIGIAKIGIAKIGIAKIGIPIGMDR